MLKVYLKRIAVIIISICLFLSSCGHKTKTGDYVTWTTYEDDTGFRFDLPEYCENLTDDDLGKAIIASNPTVEFVALVKLPSGNSVLSVSVFDLGEINLIDSAMSRTIRYVPKEVDNTSDRYKLVDYGIKRIDDKDLRYKISCVNDSVYNIMYYFMREDSSRLFYEIKSACTSHDQIKTVQDLLEEIGMKTAFNNDSSLSK